MATLGANLPEGGHVEAMLNAVDEQQGVRRVRGDEPSQVWQSFCLRAWKPLVLVPFSFARIRLQIHIATMSFEDDGSRELSA
jgi:hypothetical protein